VVSLIYIPLTVCVKVLFSPASCSALTSNFVEEKT
jgi:hypothetical protein